MGLTWDEIKANAMVFSKRWAEAVSEKQQDQGFIEAFLHVFGISDSRIVGTFQEKTKIEGHTKWIDYLWKRKIAIEMKTRGENLDDAMEQLRQYMYSLPEDEVPDLWLVSDFENIRLSRRSKNQVFNFKTNQLHKYVDLFADITNLQAENTIIEHTAADVKAAERMAKLHDALKNYGYDGHDLEVYLVRLLFCMFANSTGIFLPKDSLISYLDKSKDDGSDLSDRITNLFAVLDMSDDARKKRTLLSDELRRFRYINGSLFTGTLPPADFDHRMRITLISCLGFDWAKISPAIFGAMFQGVMDKEQRRELGAHYTSEENILKLINPLFMDELRKEFNKAKTDIAALDRFHDKIANLKFLDPACGCGNFLIITYRELRRLELEIMKVKKANTTQLELDIAMMLKVNVDQFYGIEYKDFPCEIAKVGMWLIDHQMNIEASELFGQYYVRLPLTQSATIVHGNALRIDWESVVPKAELSYILGNPPFVGARTMGDSQKSDMLHVFGNMKGIGNLDYVTAWYKKAADMMDGEKTRTAFVSTNSISQGEQVAILWKPLMEHGIHINFGIPTFKWSNEAKGKAAVHCVIVGFSYSKTEPNINPYLLEAPTVFIDSRSKPLCDVPEIGIGNKPIDGGHYLFTEDEKAEFLKKEPQAEKWFRQWIGADEFINGYKRYCLWLGDCPPNELRTMPEAMKRVDAVKNFRLESKSEGTRKIADKPRRFHVENMPKSNYIVIPEVSSERRRYIPIGFLPPDILSSNLVKIIPDATLYHFGILTSSVHMAWTRAVCGRLKSDYRYSKDIVYNNFPWPATSDAQKEEIGKLAQTVLDARSLFPDSSLADLYDPVSMPPELLNAHQGLDRAVMLMYGFRKEMAEAEIVGELMGLYRGMVGGKYDSV